MAKLELDLRQELKIPIVAKGRSVLARFNEMLNSQCTGCAFYGKVKQPVRGHSGFRAQGNFVLMLRDGEDSLMESLAQHDHPALQAFEQTAIRT